MLEQQILFNFVAYPQKIAEFLNLTSLKVFTNEAQPILKKILELNDKEALNLQTLKAELPQNISESEYFIKMCASDYDSNFIKSAPTLIKNYKLYAQRSIADKLIKATNEAQILDISSLESGFNIAPSEFKNLAQWQEYINNKPPKPKLKTGFSLFDRIFDGGFELGQLCLISGDPEAGKTRLGVQILEYISLNYPVCFFCFEFTIESYLKTTQGKRFNKDNIFIINDGYDINEVAANIKEQNRLYGTRFFLIDSQMRITTPSARNMEEEESSKFSTLARLAHSSDLFIMLIIQTSKNDRDNPMGSKKGGHESSITIRIEHTAPIKDEAGEISQSFHPTERKIHIKKNKQTNRHDLIPVFFNNDDLRFYENAPNAQEQKDTRFEAIGGSLVEFYD